MILKKEEEHAKVVDTFAKSIFMGVKAEFDKLHGNKLVNVSTRLNDLKTKKNDLDVSILKTVPVCLKQLSDLVSNIVIKQIVHNKLNR